MSQARHDFSEKRNFIRMKIDTPAKVIAQSNDMTLEGVCRDLSGGGMLIEVDKTLPTGTELEITVASEHSHSPMLRAKARVSRIIGGPNDKCTLGLEILEMLT